LIAVHVHANKVAAQLQMMSHKVLGELLDEESLTSRIEMVVSLKPLCSDEAQTNGMYNEIARYSSSVRAMCSWNKAREYQQSRGR
jgi:hypothetical protein